jgi:hypothetical protein
MFMGTRRRFIRACSALAASAVLLPVAPLPAARRWQKVSLAGVAFGTLAAQVNSRFFLHHSNGTEQPLVLIGADRADGADFERFSLLFRGNADSLLGQDTYIFEHACLGRFEMFIVPVGRRGKVHCHYEAVFCRPTPVWHTGGHQPT